MSWSVSDIQDKSGTIALIVEGSTTLFHTLLVSSAGDFRAPGKHVSGTIEVEVEVEGFDNLLDFFLVSSAGDLRAPGKHPSRLGYS